MSTDVDMGRGPIQEERDVVSFSYPFRPCRELLGNRLSEDDKISFVGQRLFFITDENDGNNEANDRFIKAHLRHLENKRVMLVEGPAGSGKSALVEEIAMLYISEGDATEDDGGDYTGGYAIATNGSQTLTELRLFSYRDGSVDVLGPLAQMQRDASATENQDKRYVFILHEYNRVNDFMSLLGNAFESDLRSHGPDSWWDENEDGDMRHQQYFFGGNENERCRLEFPSNLKIILTGNPPRGGFAGVVGDFMVDGALRFNRLLGAKVVFDKEDRFSLHRDTAKEQEQEGDALQKLRGNLFPCGVIVHNLLSRFQNSQEDIRERITHEINSLVGTGVNPGKVVAEIRRYCEVRGFNIPRARRHLEQPVEQHVEQDAEQHVDRGLGHQSGDRSQAGYIFQTNPDRFKYNEYLAERLQDDGIVQFDVRQHSARINVGDIVFLYRCGQRNPGIFALGKVIEGPQEYIDDGGMGQYWRKSRPDKDFPRVKIRVCYLWGHDNNQVFDADYIQRNVMPKRNAFELTNDQIFGRGWVGTNRRLEDEGFRNLFDRWRVEGQYLHAPLRLQ